LVGVAEHVVDEDDGPVGAAPAIAFRTSALMETA
jgi:hypothetical protein